MWGHIQRSSNKMVYARNVASIADDDDAISSVCFPVSAIRGFRFNSGVLCSIHYECPYQYVANDNDDNDIVIVTIPSVSHKVFIENLVNEIAFGEKHLVILGDDVTNEYLDGVSNVNGITSDIGAD